MPGRDLTDGSIPRHLARLTGPMTVGVLAVISVGLADAYFIGQLGETGFAAAGFIFPVTATLTSLGIGLSAGANAIVSQALQGGAVCNAEPCADHAALHPARGAGRALVRPGRPVRRRHRGECCRGGSRNLRRAPLRPVGASGRPRRPAVAERYTKKMPDPIESGPASALPETA
jgi:hypothetical protein